MAHELTHVVQQGSVAKASSPIIQCWRFGLVGAEPDPDYEVVPANHRRRVRTAMAIINSIRRNRRCRNYFRSHCTDGSGAAALNNAYRDAVIWFFDTENSLGDSINGTRHIAYTRYAYRIGRWTIAGSLLHEMFHTCDPVIDPTDEPRAEDALDACRLYAPFIESAPASAAAGSVVVIEGFGFGPGQGPADRVTFGGRRAAIVNWGRDRIEVRVPAAATGPIVVYNNNVASNRVAFTLTP